MSARCIMVQGTGSSVGKSLLVTALCRIFKQDGYKVAPFKAQNMALNSFITAVGEEMGRAQVVQAEACGIQPAALMNPILLKPTGEKGAQVICLGKALSNMTAGEYQGCKAGMKDTVRDAYTRLARNYDIIVIEGAGSPAEINLREADLVNMGMAAMVDAPVVLVGDIDKGGVFAWLAGTMQLLTKEERERVQGVIINKFRGDIEILKPGLKMLEDIIQVPVLGVVPYLDLNIDDEDSVTEEFSRRKADSDRDILVKVVRLPYMSNFTDFNALRHFPDVCLQYINRGESIGKPDILILPGSKNTLSDLLYLRETGWEWQIQNYYRQGGCIIGICGGFQMLGRGLSDPSCAESDLGRLEGLGLLDIDTVIGCKKVTTQVKAEVLKSNSPLLAGLEREELEGYEIHMGLSTLFEGARPFIEIKERLDSKTAVYEGAIDKSGQVLGTYLHGIFDNTSFTRQFLNNVRKKKGLAPLASSGPSYKELKEKEYDRLAAVVRENLDVRRIYEMTLGRRI